MTRLTRFRKALGLVMGIAGLVCSGFGQQQPGAATTPAPATPGGTTTPRTTTATSPTQENTGAWEKAAGQTRPIFISGKVMLDSGGPPPDSVVIQRLCNGNPRVEAYTDSKGRFSFQLGQNNGVMQGASMGSFSGTGTSRTTYQGPGQNVGLVGLSDLMGCEIRASLAGYRSDLIPLAGRREMENPDIGTIVLHRMGNVEGVSISASSLNAPKDARKAYEKGVDLMKKKKAPEARKEIEKAVELYPQYAAAWFDLGRIKEAQNDVEGARAAYAQSVVADPKFVNPYRQLIGLYMRQQKWQEVADTSSTLLKLDSVDFPEAHYYNAVSNFNMKNFDAAEKSVRSLQKLDTQNQMPKSGKLLGAILVEKNDYVGAAEQIKKYLSLLPAGQDDEAARKQLVELERVAGVAPQSVSPR